MPGSYLSWVDFDSKQKQKMSEVIRLFSEQGVRDELGFGTLRDILAEELFPGTSTIQTRAKYFLFIPYMFLEIEEHVKIDSNLRKNPLKIAALLETKEKELIRILRELDDSAGTIGKQKEDLDRFSNEIYWAGLKRWGILKKDISRIEYFELLIQNIENEKTIQRLKKHGEDDYSEKPEAFWNGTIDKLFANKKISSEKNFKLHPGEAAFLRNQINETCPASVLNWILSNEVTISGEGHFWSLESHPKFNKEFTELFHHAKNFSQFVQGTVGAYFYLCSKESHLEKDYEEFFEDWFAEAKELPFKSWTIQSFLQFIKTLEPSRDFTSIRVFMTEIKSIFDEAGSYEEMLKNPKLFSLISNREENLKGRKRARLVKDDVRRNWINSHRDEAIPASAQSYRWYQVRRIVRDILESAGEK